MEIDVYLPAAQKVRIWVPGQPAGRACRGGGVGELLGCGGGGGGGGRWALGPEHLGAWERWRGVLQVLIDATTRPRPEARVQAAEAAAALAHLAAEMEAAAVLSGNP